MSVSRVSYGVVLASLGLALAVVPIACGGSSGDDASSGASGNGASTSAGGSAATGGTSASVGGASATTGGSSTTTGGTTNSWGGSNGAAGALINELCGTQGCQCSNGKDDDGDGEVDGFDTECTGPLDNDEGSFATGISGDNKDPNWQDCFFDGNSGAGEDKCRYHTGCLTGEKPQTDPDCKVSAECVKYCGARTPNGCDCFGCCSVQDGSGTTLDVLTMISTCSVEKLGDEKACPRCEKSTMCANTCGTCELCPGKTVADLPEECTPSSGSGGAPGAGGSAGAGGSPPAYTCDGGEQVCGAGLPSCLSGFYCSLGCCLPSIR